MTHKSMSILIITISCLARMCSIEYGWWMLAICSFSYFVHITNLLLDIWIQIESVKYNIHELKLATKRKD